VQKDSPGAARESNCRVIRLGRMGITVATAIQ